MITLISEDCTGRKIDKLKANTSDENSVAKIIQFVIDKYGLKLKIKKIEKPKGLDWLKSDEEFKW